MLFVRDVTGSLGMLLKQLDEAVTENQEAELRSFVVFLTEDADDAEDSGDGAGVSEATRAKLTEFAEKFEISENVPLLIVADPAKLEPFLIDKDAQVTVVLYRNFNVLGNFAFKAGELTEPGVQMVTAAIPSIIPTEGELKREAEEREEAARKWREAAEKAAAEKAAAEKAAAEKKENE